MFLLTGEICTRLEEDSLFSKIPGTATTITHNYPCPCGAIPPPEESRHRKKTSRSRRLGTGGREGADLLLFWADPEPRYLQHLPNTTTFRR
jgi:hypothetical protein